MAGWLMALSDRLVLAQFVSLAQLGIYGLAFQVASIMYMVGTAANTAWTPFLFKRDAAEGAGAKERLANLTTYYVLLLFWVALALALVVPAVIEALTPPEYWGAIIPASLLIWGMLFGALSSHQFNVLMLRERTGWVPVLTLVAGAFSVGVNVALVPHFGILGSAAVSCASSGLLLLMSWALARRSYEIPYEYRRLGLILAATALVYVTGLMVSLPSPWVELGVRGAVVLLLPAVLATVGFFSAGERERMSAWLAHLRMGQT